MSTDRIEKKIELKATQSRVWRALTDYREFGAWFKVAMEEPFVLGKVSRGKVLHPGYEHVTMEIAIMAMDAEELFSYTWHPYAIDPKVDYSQEPQTLVEYRLSATASGSLLVITESGFDKLPAGRRDEAFRKNDGGWSQQIKNIERHVAH